MDKVWLKSYPPGMPETIDIDAYQSVAEVFDQAAAKYGDRRRFSSTAETGPTRKHHRSPPIRRHQASGK
jgi:long-chain acyl-CoA synthetase